LRISAGGAEVARFPFSGSDFAREKAIIAGEIYRKGEWRFAAVGQGFDGGLDALLKHFGGEQIEDSAPAAPPPSPAPAAAPPPAPSPPPAPKVSISKITLDKKGDKQTVDLSKAGGAPDPRKPQLGHGLARRRLPRLRRRGARRTWTGVHVPAKNGEASVIQALGGNFGSKSLSPHIFLDKDDRAGRRPTGRTFICTVPRT
jgi:tellurite resistance protein TerA